MTAEALTATLEALPLGEPWAALVAAANSAHATQRDAADAVMFPDELTPVPADAIAAYGSHVARPTVDRFPVYLADVHWRSLITYPALASLCRSREAREDVGASAARTATPAHNLETHATAQARAATEALSRYKLEIARQLSIAVVGHELREAAQSFIDAETLAVRVAAAQVRHEEHARAELARAEMERRAAARAVIDRTVERVREAERQAEDARARALLTAEDYRRVRGEALIERLRESGLNQLRVGADGALYGVDDLIATAGGMSLETLARFESALSAIEMR